MTAAGSGSRARRDDVCSFARLPLAMPELRAAIHFRCIVVFGSEWDLPSHRIDAGSRRLLCLETGAVMLYRLIYVSRLSDGVDLKETRRILAASQANNPSRAITGALVFNSGYFLQWIEGSRREISALFARLTTDPRHFAPEILDFSSVARREFGEWSMGYVGEGVLNQELFSRYSHSTSFDPYQLDGPSAVEFMREAAAVSLRMGRSPRVGAETAA